MLVFSLIKLTHNLVDTIIYNIIIVQGHDRVWPQFVLGHQCVWAQSCMCTIMWAQHVWAQMCLDTKGSECKRVSAQTCLGTYGCGHKRIWAQRCVGTVLWAQSCMDPNMLEPFFIANSLKEVLPVSQYCISEVWRTILYSQFSEKVLLVRYIIIV